MYKAISQTRQDLTTVRQWVYVVLSLLAAVLH